MVLKCSSYVADFEKIQNTNSFKKLSYFWQEEVVAGDTKCKEELDGIKLKLNQSLIRFLSHVGYQMK